MGHIIPLESTHVKNSNRILIFTTIIEAEGSMWSHVYNSFYIKSNRSYQKSWHFKMTPEIF